jgi:hypothetical protein
MAGITEAELVKKAWEMADPSIYLCKVRRCEHPPVRSPLAKPTRHNDQLERAQAPICSINFFILYGTGYFCGGGKWGSVSSTFSTEVGGTLFGIYHVLRPQIDVTKC